MTTTTPCMACTTPIAAGVLLCPHCGTMQGSRQTAPIAERHPAIPEVDPGDVSSRTDVACPSCGAMTSQALCFACGHSTATPAPTSTDELVLTLPDGSRVSVGPNQSVDLGRASGHPQVAAALAAYDGVSRNHATLSVAGDRVTVQDRSTNGTRVDGARIDGSFTASLSRISVLQLGHYCVIHVTRERGDHDQS